MKHTLGLLLAACALTFTSAPAFAGDKQALAKYEEAKKRWKDPDTAKTDQLLADAVKQAESKHIRVALLYNRGFFHQGITGDFDAALKYYQTLLNDTIGLRTKKKSREINNMLFYRAQALLGKGTIVYSKTSDPKRSLELFEAAHANWASAQTADVCSQMMFRVGRASTSSEAVRKQALTRSLKLADEALKRDKSAGQKNKANTAKFRLQKVIVLAALGRSDEAKKLEASIDASAFNDSAVYQRAVLLAVREGDAAEVTKLVKQALNVRLTKRTRNQLRHYIRTEADFRRYKKRPDWKELVTDESEDGK